MKAIDWLQEWYSHHCDGDWEHERRIHIGTLDNPGWSLEINLTDTELEGRPLEPVALERSAEDWIDCRIKDGSFHGNGGKKNLGELLGIFQKWAESK